MPVHSLDAPALVVVDIQAGTLPNARSVGADDLLDRSGRIADAFRARSRPIWFVLSTGTAAGTTEYGPGGRVWPDGFAAFDPRLESTSDEVVLTRAGWSAFAGTDLSTSLSDAGIREVVIIGLATTFGVESTARAASDLGFDVIVVADAVSDPDPVGHERSLTRVIPALGRVMSTQQVVEALERTSPHGAGA